MTIATVPSGTMIHVERTTDSDPECSFILYCGKWYLRTYVTDRPLHLAHFCRSSATKVISSGVTERGDWNNFRQRIDASGVTHNDYNCVPKK